MTTQARTYTINTPGAKTLAEARTYMVNGKPVTVEVTDTTVTVMVGCDIAHTAPRPDGLDNIAAVADYAITILTAPVADENGVTIEASRYDTVVVNRIVKQDAEAYSIITAKTGLDSTRCLYCYTSGVGTQATYVHESYTPAKSLGRAVQRRTSVCIEHAKKIAAK